MRTLSSFRMYESKEPEAHYWLPALMLTAAAPHFSAGPADCSPQPHFLLPTLRFPAVHLSPPEQFHPPSPASGERQLLQRFLSDVQQCAELGRGQVEPGDSADPLGGEHADLRRLGHKGSGECRVRVRGGDGGCTRACAGERPLLQELESLRRLRPEENGTGRWVCSQPLPEHCKMSSSASR